MTVSPTAIRALDRPALFEGACTATTAIQGDQGHFFMLEQS